MRTNDFAVEIPNVHGNFISIVQGLHESFGKNLVTPQVGPRHQFLPSGTSQCDNIRLEVSVAGTTDADLDTWVQNVSSGQIDKRTAVLHALDQTLQNTIADITLFDLSPVAFPAFLTSDLRRTIILSLVRFEIQRATARGECCSLCGFIQNRRASQ